MAQQKVNHISYLSVNPLDLSLIDTPDDVDVCILPEGAEIIDVTLEVSTPAAMGSTATLNIDGKDFITSADITSATCHRSATFTTLKKASILKGNFGSANSGEVVVRVHYFLPSQILAEYADTNI